MDEPSTQEPACVVRDPLNGKTALREACASLLRGEPYGDLDPSQRCALLRTLIDAALNTKTVTEEINKRATKIANAESAISASRRVEAPSRHRRDSFPGMMDVGGFFIEFEAVRTRPRCSAQVASGRRARRPCRTTTCAVGDEPKIVDGI